MFMCRIIINDKVKPDTLLLFPPWAVGSPTCGTLLVRFGQTCMSVILAAGFPMVFSLNRGGGENISPPLANVHFIKV